MVTKKAKPKKTKGKKTTTKKSKGTRQSKTKINDTMSDSGIVVIEDDLKIDKDAELEARKAYLEEARSQEASD